MSSINQILNSALMESSTNLEEGRTISKTPDYFPPRKPVEWGTDNNLHVGVGQLTGSNTVGIKNLIANKNIKSVGEINKDIDLATQNLISRKKSILMSVEDQKRKKVGFMEPSEKPNWMDKNAGRVDKAIKGVVGTSAVVGTGVIGNEIRKSDNERIAGENAQVAAHKKALDTHAAAQAATALPSTPPKSFIQKYGDQAKEMWDKVLANPDAGKYGAAGLVALGAGIGAVALAKKLRAKKAAVKK